MEDNDILKFTVLLVGIGEIYSKTLSEQLIEVYWKSLKSFDFLDIQQALQAHVTNPDVGQYFPKPADVVRFIEGSGETRALQAWAKLERAMIEVGIYQSLAFDDVIIHAVLEEMGGWIKLCSMTLTEMPFQARDFQKRYMGYVHKKPKRHPPYFCGIVERDNAKDGYPREAPLWVGEANKVAQVMATGGGTPLLVQTGQLMENVLTNLLLYREENPHE